MAQQVFGDWQPSDSNVQLLVTKHNEEINEKLKLKGSGLIWVSKKYQQTGLLGATTFKIVINSINGSEAEAIINKVVVPGSPSTLESAFWLLQKD